MKYLIKNAAVIIDGETILDDINFEITDNNHIGIVGANGAGKTTLLNALINPENLEEGIEDIPLEINKIGNFSIGYLNQISFNNENNTLEEEIKSSFQKLIKLEKKIEVLLKKMEETVDDKIIEEYTKSMDSYTNLGGYTYKKEYEVMLKKFGFTGNDKEKKISSFSGGEKTKIAFMKLLLSKPDILFLDEPTNHLDVEAIIWLENYLKNYKGAFVIVSHDRMFLNNTVNIIYDISYGKVTKYRGNYEYYEKTKKENYEKQLNDYERQQKEIARLNALYEKFRSKPTKAKMALSKLHMIERMELIDKPMRIDQRSFKMSLDKIESSGRTVLTCKDLEIGYDKVLANLNFQIEQGKKIGVIGANGTGKSTLLKTIYGLIKPLKGTVSYGYNVKVGYFDQNLEVINPENTILEEFLEKHDISVQEARSVLGAFLFTGQDIEKQVKVLSGGEKVRLQLCEILYSKPNFLILDEPTNHMDLVGKQQLEKILESYKGTMIFVSHDRYFVKKIATDLIVFGDEVKYYPYGYDKYLEKINEKQDNNQELKNVNIKQTLVKNNTFELKKEFKRIERDIEKCEKELKDLKESLFLPEIYSDYQKMQEVESKQKEIREKLKKLNARWDEIAQIIL